MGAWTIPIIAAAGAVALLVFVPFLVRAVSILLRVAILVAAAFSVIAGTAILMNNETVNAPPGFAVRSVHFLTANYAATSLNGLGSARCAAVAKPAEGPKAPGEIPTKRRRRGGRRRKRAADAHARAADAAPSGSREEEVYPELVTRGYPGIPRDRLFRLAEDAVNGLGGWKIIGSDPLAGTLDCVYTTRALGFQDDVKVMVTDGSEIELCSQSRTGEPGSTSWLRLFHGDFGANMGHIQEFYFALEPKVEAFYRGHDEREKARRTTRDPGS